MGMNTTLNTVSWLTRLFWLMLMKPMVASIKKLILSNRNEVWLFNDSMLRRIWRASSIWSADRMRPRIRKFSARCVSRMLLRMRPFRSSSSAISARVDAA